MFAHFILPYLSSKTVIQIYEHLKKKLYPNLDLFTFLETYHCPSNIGWGLEEEYIFYPLLGDHGLFSTKTTKAIKFESIINPTEEILALLPSK